MTSFFNAEMASLRSSLSRTAKAWVRRSPMAAPSAATIIASATGADHDHFGLPASATSSLIALIATCDRTSVVLGRSVSVRVDRGGRRNNQKKNLVSESYEHNVSMNVR